MGAKLKTGARIHEELKFLIHQMCQALGKV